MATTFTMDPDWLVFDPRPVDARRSACRPAAVDAHCHVFGPGDVFPFAPERKYTPCDASAAQLFALRDRLGLRAQRDRPGDLPRQRQPGAGQRAARRRRPGPRRRHRDPGRSPTPSWPTCTRPACAASGSTSSSGWSTPSRTTTTAGSSDRIAPLGWHVVVYFEAADLLDRWDLFTSLPTDVVVDHMGRPDVTQDPSTGRSSAPFLELMERPNVWAKVTCPERLTADRPPGYDDVVPFARRVVERLPRPGALGHRLAAPQPEDHMPDDGQLVDFIPQIAPTADLQQRLAGRQPDPPLLGSCT